MHRVGSVDVQKAIDKWMDTKQESMTAKIKEYLTKGV
jgi:hypothetical protein